MTPEVVGTINVTLDFIGFSVIGILALGFALGQRSAGPLSKQILRVLVLGAAINLMDGVTWFIDGQPRFITLMYAVCSIEYMMIYLAFPVIWEYLAAFLFQYPEGNTNRLENAARLLIRVISAAGIAMTLLNLFSPILFTVDANGSFQYEAFVRLESALEFSAIIIYAIVILKRKSFLGAGFWSFALVPFWLLVSVALQVYDVYLNIGFLVPFVLIALEMHYHLRQQLAEQKIAVMLSQIQPHFLSNALMAIHHLCETDSHAAGDAIDTFALYLRKNIDSLESSKPIPFADELEHTKAYLAIEKLRHKEMLNVDYDIQTTDFLIPPLTLQPLAENAVRHGLANMEFAGDVTICAKRCDKGVAVTVIDNGVGFEPASTKDKDTKGHIGLTNVSGRISKLCGGVLTITSEPGKGTVVEIFIPT